MKKNVEILKAKISLFEHRAFWWVMEDLALMKGVECETMEAIKCLERLYRKELEENNKEIPKYKQTDFGQEFL